MTAISWNALPTNDEILGSTTSDFPAELVAPDRSTSEQQSAHRSQGQLSWRGHLGWGLIVFLLISTWGIHHFFFTSSVAVASKEALPLAARADAVPDASLGKALPPTMPRAAKAEAPLPPTSPSPTAPQSYSVSAPTRSAVAVKGSLQDTTGKPRPFPVVASPTRAVASEGAAQRKLGVGAPVTTSPSIGVRRPPDTTGPLLSDESAVTATSQKSANSAAAANAAIPPPSAPSVDRSLGTANPDNALTRAACVAASTPQCRDAAASSPLMIR